MTRQPEQPEPQGDNSPDNTTPVYPVRASRRKNGMRSKNPEDVYADMYASGRHCKNLWKYIPAKVREGVTNAFADSDGYWVWLDHEEGGWVAYDGAEDCGTIHEYTISGLKEAVKTIRKEGLDYA